MPLHPQAAQFLEQYTALGVKPAELCTPAELRENMRRSILRAPDHYPLASITDRVVPSLVAGGEIPVRIYRGSSDSSLPVLVFYHGGGWVAGDLDTHDLMCRAIAHAAQGLVVSVDYRRAPEYRFPTAAEDCYSAWQWTLNHSSSLGGDPGRIAVAGDSAGGNLAAAVPLMARDRQTDMPWRQILIYPITDWPLSTTSYEQFADGHLLTRRAMQWFWDQYIPNVADRQHPYACPNRVNSLLGLPPALVVTAECDVLRDEGETYARRLVEAGVVTEITRYDGMLHGFAHRVTTFDAARQLVDQIAKNLHGPHPQ